MREIIALSRPERLFKQVCFVKSLKFLNFSKSIVKTCLMLRPNDLDILKWWPFFLPKKAANAVVVRAVFALSQIYERLWKKISIFWKFWVSTLTASELESNSQKAVEMSSRFPNNEDLFFATTKGKRIRTHEIPSLLILGADEYSGFETNAR